MLLGNVDKRTSRRQHAEWYAAEIAGFRLGLPPAPALSLPRSRRAAALGTGSALTSSAAAASHPHPAYPPHRPPRPVLVGIRKRPITATELAEGDIDVVTCTSVALQAEGTAAAGAAAAGAAAVGAITRLCTKPSSVALSSTCNSKWSNS